MVVNGTSPVQRKSDQVIMTVHHLDIDSKPRKPVPPRLVTPHRRDLGQLGSLVTRLAITPDEVEQAQRLRYDVFVDEMGAYPSADNLRQRRDHDTYDEVCDHLLVIDEEANDRIVGTYRLLPGRKRGPHGFYTATEFDLDRLLV
ncbi:MAG: GNAT family N-acetyltransferase, partial [Pseudomonadota bacterium]